MQGYGMHNYLSTLFDGVPLGRHPSVVPVAGEGADGRHLYLEVVLGVTYPVVEAVALRACEAVRCNFHRMFWDKGAVGGFWRVWRAGFDWYGERDEKPALELIREVCEREVRKMKGAAA
jgi:hypothetical protein